ncbi:MAG TPA: OmpA family protein [Candidatus Methylomirabilis sp.]|nr:OmpA family protein [Candidatus Methylomirabilis sp.]
MRIAPFTLRPVPLAGLVALLVAGGGCAEKTATAPATPEAAPPAASEQPAQPAPPPSASAPAPAPAPAASARPAARPQDFAEQPALKDLFFDAGKVEIGAKGVAIMEQNARWLAANPGYLVLIEGHSDWKGTADANTALATQRAKAAMEFFIREGIPETRLQIVSYGSERPTCPEKTDACAAKNRRVHFLVKPL